LSPACSYRSDANGPDFAVADARDESSKFGREIMAIIPSLLVVYMHSDVTDIHEEGEWLR
jgi:hypothetical protein